jgi:hypothetical protein
MPESIDDALEFLKEVPSIVKVVPFGEIEGWLRLELVPPHNGEIAKAHEINNKILSALIRAKVPILAFEVEGSRLQDVFLHLTEEAIQ